MRRKLTTTGRSLLTQRERPPSVPSRHVRLHHMAAHAAGGGHCALTTTGRSLLTPFDSSIAWKASESASSCGRGQVVCDTIACDGQGPSAAGDAARTDMRRQRVEPESILGAIPPHLRRRGLAEIDAVLGPIEENGALRANK